MPLQVSCLNPPPVPAFGTYDTEAVNFESSWFNISTIDKPRYKVYATKRRLHQPDWIYDAGNTTDQIEIWMNSSKTGEFEDLYSIVTNGENVTYTCPIGYVFNATHNISFVAICSNWTWESDFNETLSCVRKLPNIYN